MKLRIIDSAFGQAGVDPVTGLEHIARIGFDCVDLFLEAATITVPEIALLERTCGRLGLPVVSLPVVALGLGDFNKPVRAYHVERLRRFTDLAARLLDDVGLPNVMTNIDISHLVSDCDGKVHGDLPPGRGVVKFGPYLQAIRELGIPGAVSVELEYSPDPERIVQWVEEAYTATARLMALAGLRD